MRPYSIARLDDARSGVDGPISVDTLSSLMGGVADRPNDRPTYCVRDRGQIRISTECMRNALYEVTSARDLSDWGNGSFLSFPPPIFLGPGACDCLSYRVMSTPAFAPAAAQLQGPPCVNPLPVPTGNTSPYAFGEQHGSFGGSDPAALPPLPAAQTMEDLSQMGSVQAASTLAAAQGATPPPVHPPFGTAAGASSAPGAPISGHTRSTISSTSPPPRPHGAPPQAALQRAAVEHQRQLKEANARILLAEAHAARLGHVGARPAPDAADRNMPARCRFGSIDLQEFGHSVHERQKKLLRCW